MELLSRLEEAPTSSRGFERTNGSQGQERSSYLHLKTGSQLLALVQLMLSQANIVCQISAFDRKWAGAIRAQARRRKTKA